MTIALSRRITYADVAAVLSKLFPHLAVGNWDELAYQDTIGVWPEIVLAVGSSESEFPSIVNFMCFPQPEVDAIRIEIARLLSESLNCRAWCDAGRYAPDKAPFWSIVWDAGQAYLADDCNSLLVDGEGGLVRIVRPLQPPCFDIHTLLAPSPNPEVMHDKDELVCLLDSAVRGKFGPDAFATEGDGLGPNHLVYRSLFNPQVEISVVAGGEGQAADRYSVQVEVNFGEPEFGIPFVGDNLSLKEVLAVLERYWRYE